MVKERTRHLVGFCRNLHEAGEIVEEMRKHFGLPSIEAGGRECRFISVYDDFGNEPESYAFFLAKNALSGFIIGYKKAKGWG